MISKIQSVLNKVEREIVAQTNKKNLSELRGDKLKKMIIRTRETVSQYEDKIQAGVREAKREGKKMRNEDRFREKLVHLKKAYTIFRAHLKDANSQAAENIRKKSTEKHAPNPNVAFKTAKKTGLKYEEAPANVVAKRKKMRFEAASQPRINGSVSERNRRNQGKADHRQAVARGEQIVKGTTNT